MTRGPPQETQQSCSVASPVTPHRSASVDASARGSKRPTTSQSGSGSASARKSGASSASDSEKSHSEGVPPGTAAAPPWDGYDEVSAKSIRARLPKISLAEELGINDDLANSKSTPASVGRAVQDYLQQAAGADGHGSFKKRKVGEVCAALDDTTNGPISRKSALENEARVLADVSRKESFMQILEHSRKKTTYCRLNAVLDAKQAQVVELTAAVLESKKDLEASVARINTAGNRVTCAEMAYAKACATTMDAVDRAHFRECIAYADDVARSEPGTENVANASN